MPPPINHTMKVTPLGTNLTGSAPPNNPAPKPDDAEVGPVNYRNAGNRVHNRNMHALAFLTEHPIAGNLAIGELYQAAKLDQTGNIVSPETVLSPGAATFMKKIKHYQQITQAQPDGSTQQGIQATGLMYEYGKTVDDIFAKDLAASKALQNSPAFEKAITKDKASVDAVESQMVNQKNLSKLELDALHSRQLADLKDLFFPDDGTGQKKLLELRDVNNQPLATPAQITAFYQTARDILLKKQREEHEVLVELYNNRVKNFRGFIDNAFQREIERAHHNLHHPNNPIPMIDRTNFDDFGDPWFQNRHEKWPTDANGNKSMTYTTPVSTGIFSKGNAMETIAVQMVNGQPVCTGGEISFPADTNQADQLAVLKNMCARMAAMGKGSSDNNPFDLSDVRLDKSHKDELVKEILKVNPKAVIYGPAVKPSWRQDAEKEHFLLKLSGKMMGTKTLKLTDNPLNAPPVFDLNSTQPSKKSNMTVQPLLSAAAGGGGGNPAPQNPPQLRIPGRGGPGGLP